MRSVLRSLAALALAAALLLAASGCGVEFRGGPTGEFTPAEPGVLTVATGRMPTAGFWLGTPKRPTGGFEYELALALADRLDLDQVRVRTAPFERLVEGELDGADLALRQLTPTPERSRYMEFSTPYMAAPPAALVRSGTEVPDMKTARELKWAVARLTTLVDRLETVIQPDRYTVLKNRKQVVRAVLRGQADAALLDLPVALAVASSSPDRLEVAAQFRGVEGLAAALPAGSENVAPVNSAIRALIQDGTVSDLAERWLGLPLGAGSFTVSGIPVIP